MTRFLALAAILVASCPMFSKQGRRPALEEVLSRIDSPSPLDDEALHHYGAEAFRALQPIANERFRALAAIPRKADSILIEARREIVLRHVANVVKALTACATAVQTGEMSDYYRQASGTSRQSLLRWLATEGSLPTNRELFQEAVTGAARSSETGEAPSAVKALIKIDSSGAADFLCPILLNKAANLEIRRWIFCSIAATRLPKALNAVRQVREGSRVIPPMKLPLPTDIPADNILATERDRFGVQWSLVEWDGIGSPEDIWIMRRDRYKWTDPVFTGFSSYWPRSQPSGTPEEGFEEHEKRLKAFITGKTWLSGFDGGVNLRADFDGDGLTDVVELWLGLNPHSPDTDGDGLNDGVDRNPVSGVIPSTPEEKVVSAAFDAFTFRQPGRPLHAFVTLPKGMRSIELDTWPGRVLLRDRPFREPTRKNALSGFWLSFRDVKINAEAGTATVSIQESGGWYEQGYLARLERIQGEWYLVELRTTFGAVS